MVDDFPVPRLAASWAERFAAFDEVEAVALGGSWTTGTDDADSDVDLEVYCRTPPSADARRALIAPRASRSEIGNDFFGLGDEWIDAGGRGIDVVYWAPAFMEDQLDRVLVRHVASIGYSTAFWHTVRDSRSLFDRSGWFADLQARARAPYPEALRRAVVAVNHPVLRGKLSSYRDQIELALRRGDRVSVQHRTTALLTSVFDILFAIDRVPHPGEKRLLQHVARLCSTRPADTEPLVLDVLDAASASRSDLLHRIDLLVDALDAVLDAEDLLPAR
ncbi:hypothetical protein [uncultured Amnibacterium sp.]|uniref:hypothetical protein n=1 Tax=uncultured Amnibacterium sp. TaxID=1631851 RepID=UPI0035CC5F44